MEDPYLYYQNRLAFFNAMVENKTYPEGISKIDIDTIILNLNAKILGIVSNVEERITAIIVALIGVDSSSKENFNCSLHSLVNEQLELLSWLDYAPSARSLVTEERVTGLYIRTIAANNLLNEHSNFKCPFTVSDILQVNAE